jgi:[ribosomal protein S18]-alanine N-acetyltransferase
MIRVYRADARDVAVIMPIMEDAFDPAFGEAWTANQCIAALAFPHSSLLIAEYDHKPAGFAISRWIMDEEELLMIGVRQQNRRKGIASALLEQVKENAISATRNRLFIEVRDGNPAVIFYNWAGFRQVGRRTDYYTGRDGRKSDAITMKCELQI